MKKQTRVRTMLAIFAALLAFAACGSEEKPAGVSAPPLSDDTKLLGLLPEDTMFLAKFGSLETLFERLAVTESSAMGIEMDREALEAVRKNLGFDPLDPQAVAAAGFEPGKPFCLSVADMEIHVPEEKQPDMDMLVLFPVSDATKAMETIRGSMEKNSATFETATHGDLRLLQWSHSDGNGCMAVKDDYLHIAVNPRKDPRPFLLSALDKESSLLDSKAFRKIAPKTRTDRDFAFYMNIGAFAEENLEAIKEALEERRPEKAREAMKVLESVEEYEAAAGSADLGATDLTLDSVLALKENSRLGGVWDIGGIDRETLLGVPDPAVLLMSFGIDVASYWRMITEAMSPEELREFDARLESIRRESGIDVEKELVENLGGDFGLGAYDGASITMLNYNSILEAGVKDEEVAGRLIEKAIAQLPPERRAMIRRQRVGEIDAYVFNAGIVQLFAGIRDGKFLFASGKSIFEDALKGGGAPGFAAALADEGLKKTLAGDRNVFYLSIDELVKIANNFAMFLMEPAGGERNFRRTLEAAGNFKYLLTAGKLEGDLLVSRLVLKTRFEDPFFVGVAELIEESKAKRSGSQPR